jgi:hypothetical protein
VFQIFIQDVLGVIDGVHTLIDVLEVIELVALVKDITTIKIDVYPVDGTEGVAQTDIGTGTKEGVLLEILGEEDIEDVGQVGF